MKIKTIILMIISFLVFSSCTTTTSHYQKILTLGYNINPFYDQYPNMRVVEYDDHRGYEFKNQNADVLVIIIEGSGRHSVIGLEIDENFYKSGIWYYILEEFKDECSVLLLEKLDFEFGKIYEYNVEVIKNYSLENLVKQYAFTIDSYLSENSYSKVIIFGYSEGACVLPRVYKNLQNKNKISGLVSGGYGGLSYYEQFKISDDSQLDMPILWKEAFKSVDLFRDDIKEHPNSLGSFLGHSYIWLNSFLDYRPFNDYMDIDIPVLFFHGALDINVAVESTRYIQENLPNKPFTFLIYEDADHNSFMESEETFNDFRTRSREWLNKL